MVAVVHIVQEQLEDLQDAVQCGRSGFRSRAFRRVGECGVAWFDQRHQFGKKVAQCKHDAEYVVRVDLQFGWRHFICERNSHH